MDGLHSALESPIPRLPDKPCLPRVKINNDKSYTKRNHLNKPYNRQAVVGLRRALVSHKNYLSQMKPNTKSYLTNFSSVYSPGSDIMSSWLLSKKSNSKKKTTSTFLETNAWTSLVSNGEKRVKRNNELHKGESTKTFLRNKFISRTVTKPKSPSVTEELLRNSKLQRQKKSQMLEFQEKMSNKIRNEYNIKGKSKDSKHKKSISKVAEQVYGERMFMNKYKSRPKFMENLNSTLSPRKEEKVCLTCSSTSTGRFRPYTSSTAIKKR